MIVRCRLNRLSHIDIRTGERIRRYEHDHRGALIHVDVKKLGNIPVGGGWRFVGPTTVYAFMQAMGLVNDHVEGCWVRDRAERQRRQIYRKHGKASNDRWVTSTDSQQ